MDAEQLRSLDLWKNALGQNPCPSVSIRGFNSVAPIFSNMSTTADAPQTTQPADADLKAVQALKTSAEKIKAELGKVIVGQEAVVEEVLIAILTRSHALLVGVPGLAKTLLVRSEERRVGKECSTRGASCR